jgi:exonuclease VII small subunit
VTADGESLRECVEELERTATRLRSGDAQGEEAAALVERCAELAARITAALDEQARGITAELPLDEWPEQERLL